MLKDLRRLARSAMRRLSQPPGRIAAPTLPDKTYARWVAAYDTLTADDISAISDSIGRLRTRPLISIVLLVDNGSGDDIARSITSVCAQLYPAWEMIVSGAAGADYVNDSRLNFIATGGLGRALEKARGDYVAIVEAGDTLAQKALFLVARELAKYPEADLVYSDEDQIGRDGSRIAPYFKSDWNPDLFLGQDYACRLGVLQMPAVRKALASINGDGRLDWYDLILRVLEQGTAAVRHLPFVLYHRDEPQFGPENSEQTRLAVEKHLRRRYGAQAAEVRALSNGHRHIVWALPEPEPLVSLIVPTRDRVDLLKGCVEGLRHETAYRELEIIVVDNNSVERATLDYFDELRGDARIRILQYSEPFNFSAINNFAVKHARGDVIGLLNNDIKVIEPGWLREMVSHAMRPEVGAVGAMLYYGDDTIQHAGVILGIGAVASHVFKRQSKDSPGYAWRAQLTQDLSAVTAACMLMRRKVFDQVGALDEENLTVAYNDVDLCLRIREAGYLVVWTPFARLYHLESASRGRDNVTANKARFEGEKAYMLNRWGHVLRADPYFSPNLSLDSVYCLPAFPPRVTPPWKHES